MEFLQRCILFLVAAGIAQAAMPPMEMLKTLPLRFEENLDQHKGARYIAKAPGFTLNLAPAENWIEWSGSPGKKGVVRTRLVGGNPSAPMDTEERSPGYVNYFVGSRGNWRTSVKGFALIRSHEVYPGIDLVFHAEKERLEYDFIVAPHADPNMIRMDVSGHRGVRVDASGDLVISTAGGDIRWRRPGVYQDGSRGREGVSGRFILSGNRTVRFELGSYDAERALIIDPVLNYSTFLGGTSNDLGRAIGLDGLGNVYIAGSTDSTDLPTVNGIQMNFGGKTASILPGDGFVAKFSSAGVLLFLTYIGGASDDAVGAVAIDSAGNAYLTGFTSSSDFPVVNAFQSQFGGLGGNPRTRTGDAFVAKLNPTGDKLIYSTYLGGNLDDIGTAIAIDSTGNAYVTGATKSTNFPLTPGAYQTRMRGAGGEPIKPCCNAAFWDPGDAFVAKIDPTGSQLVFSTYLGGSLDDIAFAIGLDSANNVYVGGCTISSDFPTTNGAYQRNWNGVDQQNYFLNFGDGFVTKLNPTGTGLIYSTYFGGTGDDCVNAIAVDSSGSVYMTGSTSSPGLPVSQGAIQNKYAGYAILPILIEQLYGDAFVAKIDPTGATLSYLTYLGGSQNDGATAIAIDAVGNAYVVGWSDSIDFPVAGVPIQPKVAGDGGQAKYVGYGDAFLAVVNPTGTSLIYSSYLGGRSDDFAAGVAVDSTGRVYMTGNTLSPDFPLTANAAQAQFAGAKAASKIMKGDAFLTVVSGLPLFPPMISLVANAEGEGTIIAPNTWVEIKGANLAPDARTWQDSDFVNNQLPTALDGVSVTINGQKAFVYYISGTQINILTPPDLVAGQAQVVVTNGQLSTAPFTVTAQATSPSLFVYNGGPYVVATHLDGTLIGPTTLYPGASTPAKGGETIVLYANGFGATTVPVVKGALSQTGALPALPQVQIGSSGANVTFAGLISPGLYQFNVVVPTGLPSGDNTIIVLYNQLNTQGRTRIPIQ
jgi:uncharacterized protein (TIGR03437 family)